MHELTPANTIAFLRRFRLKGGVIRRMTLQNISAKSVAAKLVLTVTDTTTGGRAKLVLVIRDVEEYRFQKRPGMSAFAIREVRIGRFDGVTFLNFDADPAEQAPKPMDYRISDSFIAGGTFHWKLEKLKE